MKIKNIVSFFVFFCLVLLLPIYLKAASFDFYVDERAKDDGNGSQDRPFKTISEAIKEAKKKEEHRQRIFIKNGEYEEDLEIEESVELYGESENGVVIFGKIEMEDDTHLENVTIRGGRVAVSVSAEADVVIKNCTIRDFDRIGVETFGGGYLKVLDSKIKSGGGKGLYIQRGKTIEIVGNEITGNDEEGIDIRSKVDGKVENNLIENNGESGIEIIVGSADLKIKNNSIRKNSASGIATQFYSERDKKGRITIESNKIENNSKFGLDCNHPQGGAPKKNYWKDSIELISNSISGNKIKAINEFCNLIDAVDENEKVDNLISEDSNDKEINEGEKENQEELKKKEEENLQKEKIKIKEVEFILEKQKAMNSETDEIEKVLKSENKIKVFFLGYNKKMLDKLFLKISQKKQDLNQVQEKIENINFSEAEEEMALRTILDKEKEVASQKYSWAKEKAETFSLWGWFKKILTFKI